MSNNYTFTSPSKNVKRFSNKIEDYELDEMLGRGGFGFVHKATSRSLGSYGREVAIKLIDKKLMKAHNMTRRVANEVEIHWQLHHPGIIELYNYFEDANYVYLITELCKNGELYRYIQQRHGALTEPEARTVMHQIVSALQYLHTNGIIHRDLKLSNLLLTENYDVKLADFGLAVKMIDPDAEQKTMCGTPNYISPEILSRQPYGLASDVWSLGCMLVTLLTGSPPFESSAVKNTLDRVSRVDYTLPDHLSSEAKDLIHRLLQKDPKKRFPLSKILNHPFFDPRLPVEQLRPLSPIFDSSKRAYGSGNTKNNTSQSCQKKKPLLPSPTGKVLQTHQQNATVKDSSKRQAARISSDGAYRERGKGLDGVGESIRTAERIGNGTGGPRSATLPRRSDGRLKGEVTDRSPFNLVHGENKENIPSQPNMRRVKSSSSASTLTSTPITKAPKSPTPTNPNTRTFSSKYLHAPNQQLTASPAIATPSPPTPVPPQYHPEQHHKSGAGVEQLPPFTTVRLKPLKQKTKHGTVTILSTGQLMLDFIGEEYLLVISGDSNQIDFYDREGDPTKLETQRPVRSYTRSSLPAQYVKKYRYAMRFVELVRSKTPKIIFYSPQAKCILMENGPLADFEMVFYNGVKVHNSVSKQSLEIQLPPSFSSDSDVPGAPTTSPPPSSLKSGGWIVHQIDTSQPPDQLSTTLSPQLLPIFQHIQECLRQCLDIERSGRLGDNNAPAGSTAGVHGAQQHYPLILKSSNCRTVSAPTGMNRAVSPPPSYHPSSMSTYTTSVGAAEAGGGGGSESAVSATIGDKHSSAHGRSAGVHNNCGDGDGDGPKATTRNQNQCHDQHGRPPQPPIPMNRQQNNGHHTPLPPSSSCRSETGKDPAGCDEQTRMSRLDSSDMCGGSYTCVASSVVGGASSGGGSGIGGGATAFSGNGGMSWCFIPDVGWCMKMAPTAVNGSEGASNTARAMSGGGAGSGANASGVQRSGDGKFVMLFLDGVSVSVEAKGQTLVVEDSRDRKGGLCDGGAGGSTADDAKRYPIDKNLPEYIKSRLLHFPKFLRLFGSNPGSGRVGGVSSTTNGHSALGSGGSAVGSTFTACTAKSRRSEKTRR